MEGGRDSGVGRTCEKKEVFRSFFLNLLYRLLRKKYEEYGSGDVSWQPKVCVFICIFVCERETHTKEPESL